MRKSFLFIVAAILITVSCKKHPTDFKQETALPAEIEESNISNCIGNTWSAVSPFTFSFPRALAYNNKAYFFFKFVGVGSVAIFDGTNWEIKASDIPIRTVQDGTNLWFVIGNKGYLARIAHPAIDQTYKLYEYDFANNTWQPKANFPGPERYGQTSFVIGNKAYIVGGISNSNLYQQYNDTWEYNQATDSWSQKANYPGFFARNGMTGFSIGTKGYVVNGVTTLGEPNGNIFHNSLLEYNQLSNSWSTKAPFPGAARHVAVSFTIAGVPYVGGGQNSEARFIDFYKYNQASNSWTRVADIIGSGQIYEGFSINSKGYAMRYDNDQVKLFKYSPLVCFSSPASPVN